MLTDGVKYFAVSYAMSLLSSLYAQTAKQIFLLKKQNNTTSAEAVDGRRHMENLSQQYEEQTDFYKTEVFCLYTISIITVFTQYNVLHL